MSGPMSIAVQAWGEDMPDWIRTLAQACEETSQNKVAARLNRSAALVSTVLRKNYAGNMEAVEQVVRGVFENARVTCPRLGEIRSNICHDWQLKARTYSAENSERLRMYRTCHNCPKFRKETANV